MSISLMRAVGARNKQRPDQMPNLAFVELIARRLQERYVENLWVATDGST